MTKQVLLVEDDDALRASLAQTIDLAGFTPLPMSGFVQARRNIRANFNGVILSDIRMPHQDGFDLLRFARNVDTDLPVILLTAHSDVPTAMRAMKEGAYDYLEKPCGTDRLIEVLTRALDHRRLVLKSRRVERMLLRSDAAALNFPGPSKAAEALRTALRQLAATRHHVHLHGPEGVGKKLAAYTISRLPDEPVQLLRLNLRTAAPDALRHLQVGDAPTDLSCKSIDMATEAQQQDLLDLLTRHSNLRLISSAPLPLAQLGLTVLQDDLTLSQQMVELGLPTLAERREDLPEQFEIFLRQSARSLNTDMPDIPDVVISDILARPWHGNLAELRSHAMSYVLGQQVSSTPDATPGTVQGHGLAEQMDAFEKLVLCEALKRANGVASKAARALDLPRNTFYDRLAKHGVSPREFRKDD